MTKREIALDVCGVAGLAFLVWGAREVYEPAGWIVAGVALLAFAVLATLAGKGKE